MEGGVNDMLWRAGTGGEVLEGETLVVFADDWGAHPSSAQHLMRRFLKGNRVVWINTVGQRLPRPSVRDLRKLGRKVATWIRERGQAACAVDGEASPEVFDTPLLPLQLGRAARAANARLLRRAVRRALGSHGSTRPIVISTLPLTADLPGAIDGAAFVYYVVDDYASWPGIGGTRLQQMDQQQAARADLVVAASRALGEMHASRTRRPVEYLPHGVDVDHFLAAREARAQRKGEGRLGLADVVFFGAIDERIDQPLLGEVARMRPTLRFLVAGPGAPLSRDLAALPNVQKRAAVSYSELPALLGQADVALLPYVQGDLGKRLSPLKAREALAAGLPVVATDVPELRSVGEGVVIGADAQALADGIDRCLAGEVALPTPESLRAMSWEAQAERLAEMLASARGGLR